MGIVGLTKTKDGDYLNKKTSLHGVTYHNRSLKNMIPFFNIKNYSFQSTPTENRDRDPHQFQICLLSRIRYSSDYNKSVTRLT